jgi:hypothetical membrane protein
MHRAPSADLPERPPLLKGMAIVAIGGWIVFLACILVADHWVPDHDWVADTISDLGAGRYEMIVDVGIYAYSLSLIALAVGASHAHLGRLGWSAGIYGLILIGLIVFLVGARNEYGDGDSEGPVIHTYLVYALGAGFAVVPWAMSAGAGAIRPAYATVLRAVTLVWVPAAPVFFLMPDGWDGLYERGLGLVTFVAVVVLALTLRDRARALEGWRGPERSRAALAEAPGP